MAQYKTIVLELIQEQTRSCTSSSAASRRLLPAMDRLRDRAEEPPTRPGWTSSARRSRAATRARSRAKPWSWRSRTCRDVCPPRRRRTTTETFSLDAAMSFHPADIRRPRKRRPRRPASRSSPSSSRPGTRAVRTGGAAGTAAVASPRPISFLRLRPRRGLPPRRYSRSRPPQREKRLSHNMIFRSVNLPFLPVAAGTGRHDAAGGRKARLAAVWSLRERPRLAGPDNARRRPHHGRNRHDRRTARHRQRRESQGPRHHRRHPHAATDRAGAPPGHRR